MKKYYECYFDEKGEINKIMPFGEYVWTFLIFWFIPIYSIMMLFKRSFSRKDIFYIEAKDFHKKKIKELSK